MSFRRGGAGKRRDAIEPAVIQALRAIGVTCYQINGRALPDVLCERRGRWLPLGIKSGEKARLTRSERETPPSWPMVHSVDQALALFGVKV
jgi:hypothetical protein